MMKSDFYRILFLTLIKFAVTINSFNQTSHIQLTELNTFDDPCIDESPSSSKPEIVTQMKFNETSTESNILNENNTVGKYLQLSERILIIFLQLQIEKFFFVIMAYH